MEYFTSKRDRFRIAIFIVDDRQSESISQPNRFLICIKGMERDRVEKERKRQRERERKRYLL